MANTSYRDIGAFQHGSGSGANTSYTDIGAFAHEVAAGGGDQTVSVSAVAITATAVGPTVNQTVSVSAVAVTATAVGPTISQIGPNQTVSVAAVTITATAVEPAAAHQTVSVSPVAVTGAAVPPAGVNQTVSVSAVTITATPMAPVIRANQTVAVSPVTLTITPIAPKLHYNQTVSVSAVAITATPVAPTISTSSGPLAWQNPFDITFHNTSSSDSLGGVDITCHVPIQDGPDAYTEGDVGTVALTNGTATIVFGESPIPGVRRAHIFGVKMDADTVEVATATPDSGASIPAWTGTDGINLFGGASADATHATKPTLYFGSATLDPWSPTVFELETDESYYKVYRAYGEHVLNDGGSRLRIDFRWKFRPASRWVDFQLDIVFCDMLTTGTTAAIPSIYLGSPISSDDRWLVAIKHYGARGEQSVASQYYSSLSGYRKIVHLQNPTACGFTQTMSWDGAMLRVDGDITAAMQTGLSAIQTGAIWATAKDGWEGKVPMFGKVPVLHTDPLIDWDAEALEMCQRFRSQRAVLASYEPPDLWISLSPTSDLHGQNVSQWPPMEPRRPVWPMSADSPTGPQWTFKLNPFDDVLGPPNRNPGFCEELQFWLLGDMGRPGNLYWPLTAQTAGKWTLGDSYQTKTGLTLGAAFNWKDIDASGAPRGDCVALGPGVIRSGSTFRAGKNPVAVQSNMTERTWWPGTSHMEVSYVFAYYLISGDERARDFLRRFAQWYFLTHGVVSSDFYTAFAWRPLQVRSMRLDRQIALWYFMETDATLKAEIAERFRQRAKNTVDANVENSYGKYVVGATGPGYQDYEAHYDPGSGTRGADWWVDWCYINEDGHGYDSGTNTNLGPGTCGTLPFWQAIYSVPAFWGMWKAAIDDSAPSSPTVFTDLPRILQIGWDVAYAWVKHCWCFIEGTHTYYAGFRNASIGLRDTRTGAWWMPRYAADRAGFPVTDPEYVELGDGNATDIAPVASWMTTPSKYWYIGPGDLLNENQAQFAQMGTSDARVVWNGEFYKNVSLGGWNDQQYMTMPLGALRCFLDMATTVLPVLSGAALADANNVVTKARAILMYKENQYYNVDTSFGYTPRDATGRSDYGNEGLAGGAWTTELSLTEDPFVMESGASVSVTPSDMGFEQVLPDAAVSGGSIAMGGSAYKLSYGIDDIAMEVGAAVTVAASDVGFEAQPSTSSGVVSMGGSVEVQSSLTVVLSPGAAASIGFGGSTIFRTNPEPPGNVISVSGALRGAIAISGVLGTINVSGTLRGTQSGS